jgi:nucleoid-associated protein YgaU
MDSVKLTGICILTLTLALSGCVARTYNLTRDRIDQDLSSTSGNRGYITGTAPAESEERKTTRTTRIFEVELGFTKPAAARTIPAASLPATIETEEPVMVEEVQIEETVTVQDFETYTVGKNDTLQKISMKFYGTTRKWPKIYEANKDVLRSPDKLYAGQTLKIPVDADLKAKAAELAEPTENLK